jgi:arylsulfatase A-like enzyme
MRFFNFFCLSKLSLLLCLTGFTDGIWLSAKKPNFLFILTDDLGYSDLGCYGSEIETPNLDKLAANGLRYSQFYNTGRCWPTRSSLLTGYYAQQIRRDVIVGTKGGGQGKRPTWAPLLPEFLKPMGYRSYHSGKWHIDGKVLDGGFNRSWHVINHSNFFSPNANLLDDQRYKPSKVDKDYYSTTATSDHAIECLQDHQQNYSDQPFFHYLAFIAPHFPLHAKPEDIAKYRDRYLSGWDKLREERFAKQKKIGLHKTSLSALEPKIGPPYAFPQAIEQLGSGEVNRPLPWDTLNDKQKRFQATKMAIHAAMIDRVDQEVGRVIQQLKIMGAYENTLIFFASDNGASAEIMVRGGGHDPDAPMGSAQSYLCLGPGFSSAANTPFRRHKTWVHEGGISTPLIAHWPAGIQAKGELRHSPGHLIDIVPTILELSGVEKPKSWKGTPIPEAPGKSLVSSFSKDHTIQRDSIWWMHEGHRAIRQGNFKLVAAKGDPWALYDLSEDRAEFNDLSSKKPDKAKALENTWNQQTQSFISLLQLEKHPTVK